MHARTHSWVRLLLLLAQPARPHQLHALNDPSAAAAGGADGCTGTLRGGNTCMDLHQGASPLLLLCSHTCGGDAQRSPSAGRVLQSHALYVGAAGVGAGMLWWVLVGVASAECMSVESVSGSTSSEVASCVLAGLRGVQAVVSPACTVREMAVSSLLQLARKHKGQLTCCLLSRPRPAVRHGTAQ